MKGAVFTDINVQLLGPGSFLQQKDRTILDDFNEWLRSKEENNDKPPTMSIL